MDRAEFERRLLRAAEGWVGVRFLHNGRTKSQGVDCLGLVVCVFREAGIELPDGDEKTYRADWYLHTPEERYLSGLLVHGVLVGREALLPGDVPYFRTGILAAGQSGLITHGGIYLGGGRMIHAITGRAVEITDLRFRAWTKSYAGAIRLKAVLMAVGEPSPSGPVATT